MSYEETTEEWRDIPGYVGYQASNLGQIRSFWKNLGRGNYAISDVPRILCTSKKHRGHYHLRIKGKMKHVHTLVLEAFVGPCPVGKECCHENSDPANNSISNIAWDTRKKNRRDVFIANRSKQQKLTPETVAQIREMRKSGSTTRQIADKFNIHVRHAWAVCTGYRWGWI